MVCRVSSHGESILPLPPFRRCPATQVFGEVFSREHQLIRADPRHATYLACGLIARGPTATMADINRNVARLRPQLKMVHWNSEVRARCDGQSSC